MKCVGPKPRRNLLTLYGTEFTTLRMHSSMLYHQVMVTACPWPNCARLGKGLMSNGMFTYQSSSPCVLLILRLPRFGAGFTV